jgi:hypothetical protein
MIWRWTDGHWRIISEQSLAIPVKADREEAAQLKAQREAQAAELKAQREVRAAAIKAQLETERAAIQAKREAERAAENARKEEKRLARKALLPKTAPVESSALSPAVDAAAATASGASASASERAPAAVSLVTPSLPSAPIQAPNTAAFEPAVRAWVKAWADRQVDTYLAFYATAFEPPAGKDRAAWAAERRESMTRPAWIKVRADQLKTSVEGDKAQARFFQVYVVAPGTVELTQKTMRWIWVDGGWKILQEQSEPLARKHSGKG